MTFQIDGQCNVPLIDVQFYGHMQRSKHRDILGRHAVNIPKKLTKLQMGTLKGYNRTETLIDLERFKDSCRSIFFHNLLYATNRIYF